MMKKQIPILLAAAMIFSTVAGCAETPDSSLVGQKNTDRLKEAAQNTEDENRVSLDEIKQQTTETYTYTFHSEDGKVNIEADATVSLPESESVPMYSLSCTGFTQEQATAAYNYLLSGKETWVMEGEDYSKEQADSDLLKARKTIAEVEENTDLDDTTKERQKQECQDIIETIEAEYDSLPDKSNPQKTPVDSTYQSAEMETLAGTEQYQKLEANTDEGDVLLVENFSLGSDGSSRIYFSGASGENYSIGDGVAVTPEEAGALCKCERSYEEAKALADGFLEAMGIPAHLAQVSVVKAGRTIETEDTTMTVYEDDYSGYVFFYGRVIDQTSVAVTASQYIAHEDTAPVWLYESIQILVNADGIAQVQWEFPVELAETIANDVDILQFSDASAIFEEMTPLIYEGNVQEAEDNATIELSYEVTVDRVELNLMRIKDSGTERTGLYVPAWVFYGKETKHYFYADEQFADEPNLEFPEPTPWIVLALNAIDGSVIDVVSGY